MKNIIFVGLLAVLTGCVTNSSFVPMESLQGSVCAVAHDDVSGFKVGCPINTEELKPVASKISGVDEFEYKLKGSFFDHVKISVINGNIEGLNFIKVYHNKDEMDKDMDAVISSLSDRWGKYSSIDVNRLTSLKSAYFSNPKSKVIQNIFAGQLYVALDSMGIISVTYTSKVMGKHANQAKKDDKSNRMSRLQGM